MARELFKKRRRRFAARAQTPNAPCFVRFASFAAFKKQPAVYRAADQQPQCHAERAGCAGNGLAAKFSSKITMHNIMYQQLVIKKKKKKKNRTNAKWWHRR